MIYLDYAATTPIDARVLAEVLPFLEHHFGNPSSVHQLGRHARLAIEEARETVAFCIGAESPECVFFTSGATESNNWALQNAQKGIICPTTEHEAVLAAVEARSNVRKSFLSPKENGQISLDVFASLALEEYDLLSAMWVNNETGVVFPVIQLCEWAHENGLRYHCDATQAVGIFETNVATWGVDYLTFSGHKLYGFKGAGVLYVAPHAGEIVPFINGGAQERRKRGGTENVVAIVALAAALQYAHEERTQRVAHFRHLKSHLHALLSHQLGGELIFNGEIHPDVPILNVSFPPQNGKLLDGEMLLLNMDLAGICLSAGSACTSGAIEPSHVLLAMGIPEQTAQATLRFSFGKDTSVEDIEMCVQKLVPIIARMRK